MSRHALLVYNPKAGSAADADLWLGPVVHRLNAKYVVTVLPTVPNMKPADIVDAIGRPLDLVIAAGGDGTVRDVMGAIADSKSDVPIGIIPLGTGNQLARNLLIYEENILADPLDEALSIIMNGVTTRMDLGLMNDQYFCICAGAGPLSDAILMPDHRDKTNWKMLAYASSVIQNFAMPPVMFKLKIDDDDNETIQVAASGLFISNIADLGLGTLSETAQLNDGLLDLCVLNPSEFGEYLHMGFRFSGGFVGGEAPYYIRKIKSLSIEVIPSRAKLSRLQHIGHRLRNFFAGGSESRPPVAQQVTAMIDGDAHGLTPMRITVVPHAVNVLVPAKFAMQSSQISSVALRESASKSRDSNLASKSPVSDSKSSESDSKSSELDSKPSVSDSKPLESDSKSSESNSKSSELASNFESPMTEPTEIDDKAADEAIDGSPT